MPTKRDVALAVLSHLNVTAVGETPSAEDISEAEDAFDGRYQELLADGTADWGPDETPEKCKRPLVQIIAYDVAHAFGKPPQAIEQLRGEAGNAWRRLQQVTQRPDDNPDPVEAKFY